MPKTEKTGKKPNKRVGRPKAPDRRLKEPPQQEWKRARKEQGWKCKSVWIPPDHVVKVVPVSQKEEYGVQAAENVPVHNRVDDPGLLRELFNDAAARAADLQDRLNDVLAEKEHLARECDPLRQRMSSGELPDWEEGVGSLLAVDALIRWREAVLRMGVVNRLLARWPRWPETQRTHIQKSEEEYTEDLDHA
jgi:hypothetical protein